MSGTTTYRTCPRSGLQFEAHAEKLMIANAVAECVRSHSQSERAKAVVLAPSALNS